MRIQALILCFLCCVASAFAKDVITKTDGTKLDAKVEEISDTVIKYRKASNPTGPVYTILISFVATVLYENGDIDTFNASTNTTTVSSNQTSSPSDDDLMQIADAQIDDNKEKNVSDVQLLRMSYNKTQSELLYNKAKKYRLIGWLGGGTIFTLCLVSGILAKHQNNFDSDGGNKYALMEGVGFGVGLGGAWCLGFNLKANSLMKQARQMQSYSLTFIENEIMQFGENKLTAGINVMGNRMTNSQSLGVSLGLSF